MVVSEKSELTLCKKVRPSTREKERATLDPKDSFGSIFADHWALWLVDLEAWEAERIEAWDFIAEEQGRHGVERRLCTLFFAAELGLFFAAERRFFRVSAIAFAGRERQQRREQERARRAGGAKC